MRAQKRNLLQIEKLKVRAASALAEVKAVNLAQAAPVEVVAPSSGRKRVRELEPENSAPARSLVGVVKKVERVDGLVPLKPSASPVKRAALGAVSQNKASLHDRVAAMRAARSDTTA